MKLLLTSGGLENQTMINALRDLIGKDFKDTKLVFIPTAANVEAGDKWWLISDLAKCKELGFKEVDIVDIAAVPKDIWEPRLQNADVIMVGGGNTSYLIEQINKSGLGEKIPDLLQTKVYVGISAGSVVTQQHLSLGEIDKLYDDDQVPSDSERGLNLINFRIAPHLNSQWFTKVNEENLAKISKQIVGVLYAIDDQTAVKVVNGKTEVVSEGKWRRFN